MAEPKIEPRGAVGRALTAGQAAYERRERHSRFAVCKPSLLEVESTPRDDWRLRDHAVVLYNLYSVLGRRIGRQPGESPGQAQPAQGALDRRIPELASPPDVELTGLAALELARRQQQCRDLYRASNNLLFSCHRIRNNGILYH